MDRPPPDPRKLLDEWMEWERGEATPGRVMANLKTAGLRDMLEVLVSAVHTGEPSAGGGPAPDPTAGEAAAEPAAWMPTV
jgi:hypothetical protein